MLSAAVLLLLGAAVVWFLWRRTAAAIKLHRKLKIRVERCMKRWELPTDGCAASAVAADDSRGWRRCGPCVRRRHRLG